MRSEPTQIEVAPLYRRLFELQNQLIGLAYCIEKTSAENQHELKQSVERTLKLIREDW